MIDRVFHSLRLRFKNLVMWLRCRDEKKRWLYENRHLRMDANLDINDEARREFHKDRYRFAASLLSEMLPVRLVLDSACGTGYGTAILKGAGVSRVIGVDLSPEAVAYAEATYQTCGITFSVANVCELPDIDDGSVDVAVSFETIEHLHTPLDFLERLSAVLRPGGKLILSTPNQWGLTTDHHFDYDYELLRDHVTRFFEIESMYVQNSGSQELWINRGAPRRIEALTEQNKNEAECFIAVCRKPEA